MVHSPIQPKKQGNKKSTGSRSWTQGKEMWTKFEIGGLRNMWGDFIKQGGYKLYANYEGCEGASIAF